MTVTCVFVRGEYPYTVEYVTRLRAMVARWMDRPFRFVCLTDQPEAMPDGVEAVPVRVPRGCFAPWVKLELFNPARGWSGRLLYLDLDVLVVAPLAELIDTPAPFVITADPPRPSHHGRVTDSFGHRIIRHVNSSVMAWDGGTQTDLFTNWTPRVASRLSGDQDWIAERRDVVQTWPREWFPRLSELQKPIRDVPKEAKILFCKVPKNHLAVMEYPALAPLWGAA